MQHFKEIIKENENMTYKDLSEKFKIVNPLISYFYFSNKAAVEKVFYKFKDKTVDLMMDSGVFSYRKKGGDVDINKYIDFLNNSADYINYAITLDYPHEAQAIIKNTDYIKANIDPRITVVPVIQSFLFNEEQIEYTMKNYDFICIGTYDAKHSAIMYNQEVQDSLKPIYALNKKYNRILHGLGRTKSKWLLKNAMDSSDSSAWARFMFSGNTPIWDSGLKDVKNFTKETKYMLHNYEDYYCKRLNIKKKDFYKIINSDIHLYWDTYPHGEMCALAYLLLEEEVRNKRPNYRTYMASSNAENFSMLNNAADMFYNRNY